MKENQFSLVIVDEPRIPTDPIPFYPHVTNPNLVLFWFHGRNAAGRLVSDAEWRRKRTLYHYNTQGIADLSEAILKVSQETKEVDVIFNNNSSGDTAENTLQIQKVLSLDYDGLNPKQLDLF